MTTMLVCGGRWYGRIPIMMPPGSLSAIERAAKEAFMMREALDHLARERGVLEVISGGATGADAIAHEWAISRSLRSTVIRADWKMFGRAAGPIRNKRMIDLKPNFVVAFTGGKGTAGMVQIARDAGVEVIDRRDE